MTTARAIFDEAILPLFEQFRRPWIEEARDIAESLCLKHGSATADDVRRLLPPPTGVDPRVMSSIFTRSKFRLIGYENSARKTCHGRPLGRFELRT